MCPTLREAKARLILGRLRPAPARTPLMRFCFHGWSHADYHALDHYLAHCEPPTARFVLADDEGIWVGSAGTTIAPLPFR